MLDRMSIPSGPREGALPIAEAARRLGVSTLRVRQYVAEGRLDAIRDNRGRLRVELGPDGPRAPRGAAVSPAELLMEELIDLREDSAERRPVARLRWPRGRWTRRRAGGARACCGHSRSRSPFWHLVSEHLHAFR
jgi:excisionase family DNA binding protein